MRLTCILVFTLYLSWPQLCAQVLPDNFYLYELATGLNEPTAITVTSLGNILVSEKAGHIYEVDTKTNTINKILSLKSEASGERGLQNIVYYQDEFLQSFLYVYYTKENGDKNILSRFEINPDLSFGEENVLFESDSLKDAIYHNGGSILIWNDHLYLGIGDQYTYNSINLDSYTGKILRLTLDGQIPIDNPIQNGSVEHRSIWSYGLRNPFSMDVDRSSGKILVNDVGYGYWEEINDATLPYLFFGWPYGEGNIADINPAIPFVDPVFKYANNFSDQTAEPENRGCAITSGSFLQKGNSKMPSHFEGKFFFSDFCNGWIKYFDYELGIVHPFAKEMPSGLIGFKQVDSTSFAFLNFVEGTINKLTYSTAQEPKLLRTINDYTASISDTLNINFFSTGKDVRLKLFRGEEQILDTIGTSVSFKNITVEDAGAYYGVVYNSFGADTTNRFRIVISGYNSPPELVLSSDIEFDLYSSGDTIWFTGIGNDLEDGLLSPLLFQWDVRFHHDSHFHPGPEIISGQNGLYFVIPDVGETSTNVWYRILLNVTDSGGKTTTVFKDIYPKIVNVVVNSSNDFELEFTFDGVQENTPFSFATVSGVRRIIGLESLKYNGNLPFLLSKQLDETLILKPRSDTTLLFHYVPAVNLKIESEPKSINIWLNGKKESTPINTLVPKDQEAILKVPNIIEFQNYYLQYQPRGMGLKDSLILFSPKYDTTITINFTAYERTDASSVYPNPAGSNFKVSFVSPYTQDLSILIFNIRGEIVYRRIYNTEIGENTLTIESDLEPGIYMVKLEGKDLAKIYRINILKKG